MQDLSPSEIEALSKAMGGMPTQNISRAQFPQLQESSNVGLHPSQNQDKLGDIKIHIEAILGRCKLPLAKLLKLEPGNIVPLDKLAGEPVDIEANGKIIAKGEIVVINDNFGVKILELIQE